MKVLKKLLIVLVLVISCYVIACNKKENNVKNIGILQLATHGALDAAREGFIKGLADKGFVDGENIKITVENPEGDPLALQQMATDLIRKCDLVLGIATDAAVALQTACKNEGKDIPILFTAVTDAVSAKLVDSNELPGKNITGTSDMNPVEAQIALMKEMIPEIKKFGVVYNISEVNSEVQANLASKEAEKEDLTCSIQTVTDAAGIATAVSTLILNGCEAIYIPTDNLVAANMPAVASICEEKGILTICGEGSMVLAGGSITYGVNYTNLGIQTGEIAARILNGAKPGEIPVETQVEEYLDITVNEENLKKINLELPQSIKDKIK